MARTTKQQRMDARAEMARLIRAGIPLINETHMLYLMIEHNPTYCAACALGTAYIGMVSEVPQKNPVPRGIDSPAWLIEKMPCAQVVLLRTEVHDVLGGEIPSAPLTIGSVVDALHAGHMWSREEIAAWLETNEVSERIRERWGVV
jgi:hypothetical protein